MSEAFKAAISASVLSKFIFNCALAFSSSDFVSFKAFSFCNCNKRSFAAFLSSAACLSFSSRFFLASSAAFAVWSACFLLYSACATNWSFFKSLNFFCSSSVKEPFTFKDSRKTANSLLVCATFKSYISFSFPPCADNTLIRAAMSSFARAFATAKASILRFASLVTPIRSVNPVTKLPTPSANLPSGLFLIQSEIASKLFITSPNKTTNAPIPVATIAPFKTLNPVEVVSTDIPNAF